MIEGCRVRAHLFWLDAMATSPPRQPIKDGFTEPYHPHQNPAENQAVRWLKSHAQTVMNISGAPAILRQIVCYGLPMSTIL